VSRLTLLVPIAWSALVCGGCNASSDRESESLASRSAPIAFSRGEPTELVVVDPDGGNERVVVKEAPGRELGGYSSFSWSPNGRQLLYSVAAPRGPDDSDTYDYSASYVDLYVVNADGSDRRRLSRANISTDPVWSPRGDAVLVGDAYIGSDKLRVINADGSGARTILVRGEIGDFAWSPDGTKIAYDTYDSGDAIYVMNADGSAPKRLTEGGILSWRPGGQIVFRFGLENWLINPDGSGLRPVGKAGELAAFGELAPDGRTAVLSEKVGGSDLELVLGDIGGGPRRRLTDNDLEDDFPSWSPDGRSIVFERYKQQTPSESGPGDIYVIEADGTGERNLTHSPAAEWGPAWAPQS
jgi:Tol biopolymer transport system component